MIFVPFPEPTGTMIVVPFRRASIPEEWVELTALRHAVHWSMAGARVGKFLPILIVTHP